MKRYLSSLFIIFFTLSLLFQVASKVEGASGGLNKIQIRSLHPILGMVVSFIGGVHVEVNRNDGPEISGDKGSGMQPGEKFTILIDRREAVGEDLNGQDSDNVHYLYNEIPVERNAITSLYYDPAALPFIGQKVMKVLSDISPENYPYFQRRLAEFKSRLQSTVMVGRKMLEGVPVFDITVNSRFLFQAAGCEIEKAPAGFFHKLEEEESADYYTQVFSNRQEKGMIVVGDSWTPEAAQKLIEQENLGIILPAPDTREDIILYLHKQFLCVWDKCRQK